MNLHAFTPEVQKIRHHSIRASLQGLLMEYLYGDGWRLVEIVLGVQIVLRGLAILFLGGMAAAYYADFPFASMPVAWGILAFVIGGGRIAGTVINGRWGRSPHLRRTAGLCAFAYQGLHCYFFFSIGLSVIAVGYLFWTILEAMGVIRSTIDIQRKRGSACLNG